MEEQTAGVRSWLGRLCQPVWDAAHLTGNMFEEFLPSVMKKVRGS
jgi:hypothetical protein